MQRLNPERFDLPGSNPFTESGMSLEPSPCHIVHNETVEPSPCHVSGSFFLVAKRAAAMPAAIRVMNILAALLDTSSVLARLAPRTAGPSSLTAPRTAAGGAGTGVGAVGVGGSVIVVGVGSSPPGVGSSPPPPGTLVTVSVPSFLSIT